MRATDTNDAIVINGIEIKIIERTNWDGRDAVRVTMSNKKTGQYIGALEVADFGDTYHVENSYEEDAWTLNQIDKYKS